MNANGKGLRRVRGRQPISADDVAWSPDGRFLAYHPFESGHLRREDRRDAASASSQTAR